MDTTAVFFFFFSFYNLQPHVTHPRAHIYFTAENYNNVVIISNAKLLPV